jgi:hypothetical protein
MSKRIIPPPSNQTGLYVVKSVLGEKIEIPIAKTIVSIVNITGVERIFAILGENSFITMIITLIYVIP